MTIPAGYMQVTHILDGSATPRGGAVVLGFQPPVDMTMQEVAVLTVEAFNQNVAVGFTTALNSSITRVKMGPDETGPSADFSFTLSGTDGTTSMPPQVAALVKKNTNEGGRAGRGRSFWPGVSEADVNQAGAWGAGPLVANQDRWNDYMDQLALSGLTMVVFHSPGAPLTTPSVVTSLTLDGRVATQRRRLRG